ncbi:hypothetical protein SRABI76_02527 [Microbacterium oxydans]|nr:hypothetical protein SRABI76_02527 [Microbacterium oxydans]
MDALQTVIVVAALASFACWVLSLITRDTSWVDRAWSIVPVAYVWIFVGVAFAQGDGSARLVIMGVLATAWGARLTFNFARKGGYSGMEDYRWAILRKRMRPWQFQIFNLLFIICYQMTLLVLITLPAGVAAEHPSALTGWDALFIAAFVAFLVGETIADQQQWRFHERKKAAGGTLAPGFATGGLFRYSRHPNFLLRAGPMVGVLRDRRRCGRDVRDRGHRRCDQLHDRRPCAAHSALHRFDDLHRVDHRLEVPGLRRLSTDHVDAGAVAPEHARGGPAVLRPRAHRAVDVGQCARASAAARDTGTSRVSCVTCEGSSSASDETPSRRMVRSISVRRIAMVRSTPCRPPAIRP